MFKYFNKIYNIVNVVAKHSPLKAFKNKNMNPLIKKEKSLLLT